MFGQDGARWYASPMKSGAMIPGSWFVAILAVSIVPVWALMFRHGMVIQYASLAFLALAGAMGLLAAFRYGLRGIDSAARARCKDFAEYCLIFMALTLLGVISTYPIAAVSSGFSDPILAHMDALMGFDWVAWYAFVIRYPLLQQLGVVAYSTIYLSPAILLGYMAWKGDRAGAQRFLVTFWLAALITLMVFPLMPAKGPLAVLWEGPIPYMPTSALYQAELIPELRVGSFTVIDLGALRGLVCAPSFHTVSGVLYMLAAWPIARLRWPLIAMNAAMLLSTPVEGNHYLTDMLLGLIVALLATVLVRRGLESLNRLRTMRPVLNASVQVS